MTAHEGAPLLASGITKRFGGLVAVDNVTLGAEPGAVTSVIGPNGAGKTTLFGCLSGALEPDAGSVELGGVPVSGRSAEDRVHAGLARTFQRLELFGNLTVAENLQVALDAPRKAASIRALFAFRHREDPRDRARISDVLAMLGIIDLADEPAGTLPTGQARLVELGRALCTNPRALLLDEPASGLDAGETDHLHNVLAALAASGLTILLVEHDVDLVMSLSSMVHVLDFGRLIASGTPAEITANESVRAAYLGV